MLRLEDTDQTRLVPGAEQNIYDSLAWTGLKPDESPQVLGPHAPYRQSERREIYRKYADQLLAKGLAYKCYCSKDRLLALRTSAQRLKPPTTVTYDRACLSSHAEEAADSSYVLRFKSPDRYLPITDVRHGTLDLQPQVNMADRRYDDFVIMKLDGLPTYHFANVIDDHLMEITHVIRGEEWLSLTPKHVALYEAFGWTPPKFVHIPLLTSLGDKKLSKRQGDNGVLAMAEQGVLPEALVNFVALFGWAPPREQGVKSSEVMSLSELTEKFRLDNLTKGNAKVSDLKLWFFNKHHLQRELTKPDYASSVAQIQFPQYPDTEYIAKCLLAAAGHLEKVSDLPVAHRYFFEEVDYSGTKKPHSAIYEQLTKIHALAEATREIPSITQIQEQIPDAPQLSIMQTLRYALTGMVPGVNVMEVLKVIGYDMYIDRLEKAAEHCK